MSAPRIIPFNFRITGMKTSNLRKCARIQRLTLPNLKPTGQNLVVLVILVVLILVGQCGGVKRKHPGFIQHNKSVPSYNHNDINHHMRTKPVSLEKEADFLAKGKICIGTNGRMSVPSNREHHYRNLKDRFTNCTYVDGNLELTWLQDPNLDLSFLQYIREVTGYVLISHVDINIVLPRLQIIRGRTLFKLNGNDDELALAITLNKMFRLELPALRDILKGSVGIINNYNLCHIKTIDWKEIISDVNATSIYVYNFTSGELECQACHKDCKKGCWGPGLNNCQEFSKTTCSPQCDKGRCFGPNPRECCHLSCAGGCTGPKQSDCIACQDFYDDGVCVSECPSMQRYNPTTYSWELNPNGKYAYGATCVKKCPEHLLKDRGACVRTCPPNKKAVNGECVLCDGACPKSCQGDVTVHSGNIASFQGCTVIEGSLSILENTFKGYQHVYPNYTFGERYTPIHPDRLEIFSTLKEVTGYLNIQAYHPDFTNLSYFRNLEIIGGRALYEMTSLYIVKTSLQSLHLKSLKKINMGNIAILENKHLCFANDINWDKITRKHSYMISNNSDAKQCLEKGLVCDKECSKDGCWGSGPEQCLSCAHYRFGTKCLEHCNKQPRIFRAENNECKPCDEQCGSSCYGPTAGNCTDCKNFRDGDFCVSSCPFNKYVENGECKPCHSTCAEGCTGPKNTVGPGGCNSCELALMNEDSNLCLPSNESCPDGYYMEYVGPQVQEEKNLKSLNGKKICRKCHPRCKKCTGYGFHELICQECANFKKGEQCEDECAMDHYPDIATHVCNACDLECRGCTGPGSENCITCQSFKLFDGGDVGLNNTFTCVASCPPEYPHRVFPENADAYCSETEATIGGLISAKSPTYVVVLVVCLVGGGLVITVFIGIILYCQRKEKMKENAIKMTMALTGLEDNEPLRPSNILPNVSQLRIIKETEIRKDGILGYGAFGTVFKAVWEVDGEKSTKIPVAIKVLRTDSGVNTNKEFLSEAYIMASIDHPNLLKLLAVCMTSQMMLITQLMPLGCLLDFVRKNKDKIGSKSLLNWSTQIARGMAYLEEKRLVHRDLAARNVLVQNASTVKITDFGLAKLLDINEEEYKAEGGKMPIKWLALECIQHRIFTHKSDVWAFGVTVWELLTFGDRPYDNVSAREVPDLLEKGDRLRQPESASIEVYMIMLKCWMLDAESRPSFKELEEDFSKMANDPGRYLAIPGDRFMRLSNHNYATLQSERDMVRSLASSDGMDIPDLDEHMQPKSRAPLHGTGLTSISASISPMPDRHWPSSLQMTSDGSVSMYPNTQNHFNNKLLRYSQQGRFFDNGHSGPHSDISSMRYCGGASSLKDGGSDEYDSSKSTKSQAQVGNLKLELPLDEEDYLMPSPQCSQGPSTYLDVIDVNYKNTEFFRNNIDNPEYLMNDNCQTVGLPDIADYNNITPESSGESTPHMSVVAHMGVVANNNNGTQPVYLPQKSSEEESDHECYNQFDRLRLELQPLQKNKDGALV